MSEICKTIFDKPRQIAKYLITIMEIRKLSESFSYDYFI